MGCDDHVKVAVLAGSVTAASLAGVLLRARSNVYERLVRAEAAHADPPAPAANSW